MIYTNKGKLRVGFVSCGDWLVLQGSDIICHVRAKKPPRLVDLCFYDYIGRECFAGIFSLDQCFLPDKRQLLQGIGRGPDYETDY